MMNLNILISFRISSESGARSSVHLVFLSGNQGSEAMKLKNTFTATDRDAWRAWLATNHLIEREVWVLFPKKHTGKHCMTYEESVEEALCFAWIDSIIKRIDDATYARKF